MTEESTTQRITRLTPLAAVLALIESRVGPIEPQRLPLAAALERTLADDAVAATLPPHPLALRDGYAVEAAAIADAGPYTPVPFASAPHRIEVGEPLPRGADTVAPLDAIHIHHDRASATAAVAPGEGVLPAGGNASPRVPLRRSGERVRAIDIAVLATAGIGELSIREPRIRIACGSARRTPLTDAALAVLARAIIGAGGTVFGEAGALDAPADDHADAVIAIGGTGSGRHDTSVQSLARLGQVEIHGIAVSPGETAAFGFVDERPVLLVPGRLDAVLAIWLLIGHPLVARLAGGGVDESAATLPLKRKVTSRIGMTELIPVSCTGGMAEPLGSGYLSLTALARSDGWIVVPADSEGFPANTQVAVKPWP